MAEMKVFSTGIDPNDWIPHRFTQSGKGVSPSILWQHLPTGTESLILLLRHREAQSNKKIYWLLYDINPLAESIPESGPLPDKTRTGTNDFGGVSYCPPVALADHQLQHYDFTLIATDLPTLGLPDGATWDAIKSILHTTESKDVIDIMETPPMSDLLAREFFPLGHIIDHAEFSGHFALDTDKHI